MSAFAKNGPIKGGSVKPLERFIPAKSKQKAVTRISALTGSGPEVLGPGSKEQKAVLINLAKGLNLGIDMDCPKIELASRIAAALNTEWTPKCYAPGQALSLLGLNTLLEAATKFILESDRRIND